MSAQDVLPLPRPLASRASLTGSTISGFSARLVLLSSSSKKRHLAPITGLPPPLALTPGMLELTRTLLIPAKTSSASVSPRV